MKFRIILSILILMILSVMACDKQKPTNAMVIILGRHANANAFHDRTYESVGKYLENTVYGGYIGVISSEGNPKILKQYYDFEVDTPNRNERKKQINEDKELVLNFLKNEDNKAITSENDLLKAIQLASKELSVIEDKARQNGKRIGEKRIVIMDAGIVTTGKLDFSMHDIDIFDFSVSDSLITEFALKIATKLSDARELPNLEGVNVEFIGLGDVALPQKELSRHVENGLEFLWKTILEKTNAKSIIISPYTSSAKANANGFLEVRSIEFLDDGWTIDNKQVNFKLGDCNYKNLNDAEKSIRRFADIITRHLNKKTDIKIYVVGSESKDQDREYTMILSECRAKTVMETLTNFGIPRDKIEAFGLAVYLPGRENDRPNNMFDPVIGEKNQKVVIIPSDIGNQVFLREVLTTRNKLYGR